MSSLSHQKKQWYRFQVVSGAVRISIEPHAWQYCAERLSSTTHTLRDMTLVQSQGSNVVPTYRPPTQNPWGFGEVLHLSEAKRGWVEWTCLLPRVYTRGAREPAHARAVVLTLSLLFKMLNQYGLECGIPTDNLAEQQLATVSLFTVSGFKGFPLSAYLSPAAATGIRRTIGDQKGHVRLDAIDAAMAEAYRAMTNTSIVSGTPSMPCSMLLLPCSVYLYFPRTQCIMRGSEHPESRGIELLSDKIESPERQLSFLAGLAALLDLIAPKIL